MICLHCKKEFEPRRSNQIKYCSRSCNRLHSLTERRRRQKLKIIEYLGGSCKRCGWKEHPAGLVAHHKDPSKKEFRLGDGTFRAWHRIQVECDKCILLCQNCHQLIHATNDSQWIILPA